MSLEACPSCGHLTRVYADAGNRKHYPGCMFDKKAMTVFPDEEIEKIAKALCDLEAKRFPDYGLEWEASNEYQREAYKDNIRDAIQAFADAGYTFVTEEWLNTLFAAYEKQNTRGEEPS